MTAEPETRQLRPAKSSAGTRVLLLNHRRDAFQASAGALEAAGFEVMETTSLRQTEEVLGNPTAVKRPTVVILNPVVPALQGVELELVRDFQADEGNPVPVILLVDGLPPLDEARQLSIEFFDFVQRPPAPEELVHRVELAARTRERFLRVHERAQELAEQVSVDFKTGLLSERYFRSVLQVEFKRAQRHHLPLSFLLVDVDNFKQVNDSTAYEFADLVLVEVAKALRDNVRETDFAARFGGDEFAVLLPHTTPAEAVHTAMRIRHRIAATVVENDRFKRQVTVSIGINTYDGRSTTTVEDLTMRANKALHECKRRGKDQVWLYSAPVEEESEGTAG